MIENQGAYERDGAVLLAGVLSAEAQALAYEAYLWSLSNPGPGAAALPNTESGTFYNDLANPDSFKPYNALVRHPEIIGLVQSLFAGDSAWFMYEQVFKKSGGVTRRTPWHQDTPYLPVEGRDLTVLWMSFESVPATNALEFVAGSHSSTLYDGSRFDPADDTAPLYNHPDYPRLPDIEGNRSAHQILSWATEPGDVIAFHPSTLHGGGATTSKAQRQTLSLRFFGDDAKVAERPGAKVANPQRNTHPLNKIRANKPGSPFRHPDFPKIF
ncbi:MAG: phytanoyl-CoA dioxygenase [Pseudomonadales bacterium]|nr:phytanoyl-CoA dioxygenase [Pseudomonadales bacterium]